MTTPQLLKLASIITNLDNQVAVANACDKAYAVGTGNPDWYAPFTAEKPEKVAVNLPGLLAVNTGVGIIAVMRGIPIEGNVLLILQEIVNGTITDVERSVLHRLANLGWAVCQPFRGDKGPLGRAKSVNIFDLLAQTEVDKDWHQILAAAIYLLAAMTED